MDARVLVRWSRYEARGGSGRDGVPTFGAIVEDERVGVFGASGPYDWKFDVRRRQDDSKGHR